MGLKTRNNWGRRGANLDQQRGDLFRFSINLPSVLGGTAAWDQHVQFAVTKFPFPTRGRTRIPTKYLNQTNFQLGADNEVGEVTIEVRYAFAQETAKLLEKWSWMHSHPNGGVALTSSIKSDGWFYWLIPGLDAIPEDSSVDGDPMRDGAAYYLEGVMVSDFKPTDADMTSNNNLVNYTMQLSIDRYYPKKLNDLKVANVLV
jgi:hypothetical protein